MRVTKRDGSPERRIVTAMIVNETVLGRIADKWQKDLFRSKWCNLIGGWAVKYYNQYGEAPNQNIEGMFTAWVERTKDKESAATLESFLEGLSGEYEGLATGINTDYTLDEAARYFKRVKLERLAEHIQGALDNDELDDAQEAYDSFSRVDLGAGAGIDVFSDAEVLKQAFQSRSEPVIVYPGALGNFFGNDLERDGFIAFEGPEKRQKTFWLQDLAQRGIEQKRKVAFFEVGDLSRNQIIRRFATRACRRPLYATKGNKQEIFNKPVRIPKFIEKLESEKVANVDFRYKHYEEPLTWKQAWKKLQKYLQEELDGQSLLKLDVYPTNSISVVGIESVLKTWERQEGFVPDIICIDYADILAASDSRLERRDQINDTWARLRGLSQKYHCLVATASQTDAASYNVYTLSRSNFSEDKRKNAHVTAMYGLNQTPEEKEHQLMRLNCLFRREGDFDERQCVHVAGCIPIANPAMQSTF